MDLEVSGEAIIVHTTTISWHIIPAVILVGHQVQVLTIIGTMYYTIGATTVVMVEKRLKIATPIGTTFFS